MRQTLTLNSEFLVRIVDFFFFRTTQPEPEEYEGNGPPRGGRIGGGISAGSQSNKNNGVDGMPSGGTNTNPNPNEPSHNGINGLGGGLNGNNGGGFHRLATDPLPPVHILGLGSHFGSSNGGGIGGSFLRGYDHRQTETLLDVCVGGGGGGGGGTWEMIPYSSHYLVQSHFWN